MQETVTDNSFRKDVPDTGKSDCASSLFECAYSSAGEPGKKPNQVKPLESGHGDSSPAGAPGQKPPSAGRPAEGDSRNSDMGGGKHRSDATPVPPMPRNGAGSDGSLAAVSIGEAFPQRTPEQFQFSKEKTAAAALNMFAKDELDLNGDGFVNKVELSRKRDELAEAAAKNPKSKEILEKQQAVNYMIMDYTKLSSAHDDEYFSESSGITIYDLASTVSSVNKAKRSGN